MPRLLLAAVVLAGAAALPAAAGVNCHSVPGHEYPWVCYDTSESGCVWGSLGAEGQFGDRHCAED